MRTVILLFVVVTTSNMQTFVASTKEATLIRRISDVVRSGRGPGFVT